MNCKPGTVTSLWPDQVRPVTLVHHQPTNRPPDRLPPWRIPDRCWCAGSPACRTTAAAPKGQCEGSKSLAGDIDEPDELAALAAGEEPVKARSLLHTANTGFVRQRLPHSLPPDPESGSGRQEDGRSAPTGKRGEPSPASQAELPRGCRLASGPALRSGCRARDPISQGRARRWIAGRGMQAPATRPYERRSRPSSRGTPPSSKSGQRSRG